MTGVWERNVTGRGVTVVVVDDGVEHTIQDIAPNYVSGPSPTTSYLLLGVASVLALFLEVFGPNKGAWEVRWGSSSPFPEPAFQTGSQGTAGGSNSKGEQSCFQF